MRPKRFTSVHYRNALWVDDTPTALIGLTWCSKTDAETTTKKRGTGFQVVVGGVDLESVGGGKAQGP